jgi:UDP-glucuronate 4-epimerase
MRMLGRARADHLSVRQESSHPSARKSDSRILVTGAAGFIGSHVCEALLRRGNQVVALDNFDTFYNPRIKRANVAAALRHPSYVLLEGDIRDAATLDRAFSYAPFAGVVHLAARAGVRPSIQDPTLYDDVNVRGTTLLIEQARRCDSGHFVHASSSSVYGATSAVPFTEDEPADRPSSPYAATKRSNELALYAYHHLYDHPITCLRFFTAYGPRQRPEMAIHKFARLIASGQPVEIFGDGCSRRDYTYIDDVVDGVLRALDRPNGYRIYNLGTTATTPVLELAERIAAELGAPLSVRHLPEQPGDVPITFADISHARDDLGYAPSVELATGLRRFVAWFREMPSDVMVEASSTTAELALAGEVGARP